MRAFDEHSTRVTRTVAAGMIVAIGGVTMGEATTGTSPSSATSSESPFDLSGDREN